MTLGEWLRKEKVGQVEFAGRIDITQGHVSKLASDHPPRISADLALRIQNETGGAVPVSTWAEHPVARRPVRRSRGGSSKRLPNHP